MRASLSGCLVLLVLAGRAGAVDVPAGPMVKIDGVVEPQEWAGATELKGARGSAFLRCHGRALLIGIRMRGPYRGERIELHAADPEGLDYSWHAFHPACAIPEIQSFPAAPVLAKRASWSTREKAPFSPPRACLFRARVHRSRDGWSAEIALGREALDVAPSRILVARLEISDPAGRRPPYRFLPLWNPRAPGPEGWRTVRVAWDPEAKPYATPEEDARRTFELELFREYLNRALGREVRVPLLEPAVGGGAKNNAKIAALLGRLDGCLAADPGDFFARFSRIRLLRRANRLEEAARAVDATARLFPYLAPGDPPLVAERFALLVAFFRFEEALRLPLAPRVAEVWRDLARRWREEQELRRRDEAQGDLPRVRFETTQGPVVVELYEEELPNAVALVLRQVEAGAYDGAVFEEVTGGFGAQLTLEKPPAGALTREEKRLPWRGCLALPPTAPGARAVTAALFFCTGHAQLIRRLVAVGRVVEGMGAVDRLERGDRIEKARVLRKRAHPYPVRPAEG